MIFVEVLENGNTGLVHYMPFDKEFGLGKSEQELLSNGLLVDNVPQPEVIDGKNPILKVDANKKLFYEYVVRPLTQDEEIAQLKKQQALMQTAIDDLIFGGML